MLQENIDTLIEKEFTAKNIEKSYEERWNKILITLCHVLALEEEINTDNKEKINTLYSVKDNALFINKEQVLIIQKDEDYMNQLVITDDKYNNRRFKEMIAKVIRSLGYHGVQRG